MHVKVDHVKYMGKERERERQTDRWRDREREKGEVEIAAICCTYACYLQSADTTYTG